MNMKDESGNERRGERQRMKRPDEMPEMVQGLSAAAAAT
jgi:hypothetical protein